MNYVLSVLQKVASVVDTAVPVAVGARTKIAVVACPLLSGVTACLPALSSVPVPQVVAAASVAAVVVPYVQGLLCSAAPFFALAGLFRQAAPATK